MVLRCMFSCVRVCSVPSVQTTRYPTSSPQNVRTFHDVYFVQVGVKAVCLDATRPETMQSTRVLMCQGPQFAPPYG